jgi:Zn-finger nucleic acid-binding protein
VTHPSIQCPRCRGPMRTYPRSGVQLDRCDQCRGIFLDEGELEMILRNESPMQAGGMPQPGYGAYQNPGPYGGGYNPGPGPGPGQYGSGYVGYGGGVWSSTDPNNPAPGADPQH